MKDPSVKYESADGSYQVFDRTRAYIFQSNPLEIALDPEVGDIIYTALGDCFKCVSDKAGQLIFELVHPTVLAEGNLITDLDKNVLELFWALSRTELKKANYGLKDTCEGS